MPSTALNIVLKACGLFNSGTLTWIVAIKFAAHFWERAKAESAPKAPNPHKQLKTNKFNFTNEIQHFFLQLIKYLVLEMMLLWLLWLDFLGNRITKGFSTLSDWVSVAVNQSCQVVFGCGRFQRNGSRQIIPSRYFRANCVVTPGNRDPGVKNWIGNFFVVRADCRTQRDRNVGYWSWCRCLVVMGSCMASVGWCAVGRFEDVLKVLSLGETI